MDWEIPNLALISREAPGTLDYAESAIPPGGNDVLTYLDVVAAEHVPPAQIQRAIEAMSGSVSESLSGTLVDLPPSSGIAARFAYLNPGLPGVLPAKDEFRELSQAALRVLSKPGQTLRRPPPILFRVQDSGENRILSVDPTSVRRISEAGGTSLPISLPPTFPLVGALLLHVAAACTSLEPPKIEALGGARFEDATGRLLFQWPTP